MICDALYNIILYFRLVLVHKGKTKYDYPKNF